MTTTSSPERKVALKEALAQLNKTCGHQVVDFGKPLTKLEYSFLSTGLPSLDKALNKGVAKGVITEIFGPPSTGKTTLALRVAAQVQKKKGTVVFLDLGKSFSATQAIALGVNVADLILAKPLSADESITVCETLLSSGAIDLLIVDAFGAMAPQHIGRTQNTPRTKSNLLAGMVRNLEVLSARSKTAVVITRRMNPNISTPAAADGVIRKCSKATIELVRECDGPSLVKIHKNIPGGMDLAAKPIALDVQLAPKGK